MSEWGNPSRLVGISRVNGRQTRGTETSQYPEEKKTTVISGVVASETGEAQTGFVQANPGLKDHRNIVTGSGTVWESRPEEVIVQYTYKVTI